jgi:hypothetical protein
MFEVPGDGAMAGTVKARKTRAGWRFDDATGLPVGH